MSIADVSRASDAMEPDDPENILSVLTAVSNTATQSGLDHVHPSSVHTFSDYPIPTETTFDPMSLIQGNFNTAGLPFPPSITSASNSQTAPSVSVTLGGSIVKPSKASTVRASTGTNYMGASGNATDLPKKDLNCCTAPEMRRHSGMSARLCSTVISEKKSGKFTSWQNLQERISGLGPKKLQLLQQKFVISYGSIGPTSIAPTSDQSKRRKTGAGDNSSGLGGVQSTEPYGALSGNRFPVPGGDVLKAGGGVRGPSNFPWSLQSVAPSLSMPSIPAATFSSGGGHGMGGGGASVPVVIPAVVGLGAAAMDTLAFVDAFPERDAKIRTSNVVRVGGGNCSNTILQLAKLGNATAIITKLGKDRDGADIIEGLTKHNVQTGYVTYVDGNSPSTYIIVDKETQTRTCIHSPATSGVDAADVTPTMLEGVMLLHLDSRHSAAAVKAATIARSKGIVVSVEVEKDRPHLKELLALADYVFTNERFPSLYCAAHIPGYELMDDATEKMQACSQKLLELCPHAKFVCTTLGDRGSVLLTHSHHVDNFSGSNDGSLQQCPFINVRKRTVGAPISLTNGNGHHLSSVPPAVDGTGSMPERVWVECDAYAPLSGTIVDSTGCGDVYVGGFLHGLVRGWPLNRCMMLATYCAASKLAFNGGQSGPTLLDIKTSFPGLIQDAPIEKCTGLLAYSNAM
eukprot:m.1442393 g.1442393  ORF g.1442393 m.1442393 type:complete len:686 (+) comp25096_c1_seq6:228-2285(+)